MTAAVAHEINNLLGGILLTAQYAEGALDRRGDRELLGKSLADIESDARRCSVVLGELQRFARADPGAHTPSDPAEIIESAIDLALKGVMDNEPEVRFTPEAGLPAIEANRTALRHALAGLVACGVESGASTIHIAAYRSDEGNLDIVLRDDGNGAIARVAERLFDPTASLDTRHRAAVLALSLAHAVAEDHGGRLDVASSPADGPSVTLQLTPTSGATKD
jgi:C4-dicarboxylate-specific signal transduction histidine kinase